MTCRTGDSYRRLVVWILSRRGRCFDRQERHQSLQVTAATGITPKSCHEPVFAVTWLPSVKVCCCAPNASKWESCKCLGPDVGIVMVSHKHEMSVLHRPPPDTTKDKEGVSVNRTALTQRSRLSGAHPEPLPTVKARVRGGMLVNHLYRLNGHCLCQSRTLIRWLSLRLQKGALRFLKRNA